MTMTTTGYVGSVAYLNAVAELRRLGQAIEDDQAGVAELEEAIEHAKWERARITWEQVQARASASQIAKDVGVNDTTVSLWAKVWKVFQDHSGPGLDDLTYTQAYNIARGRTDDVKQHGSRTAAESAAHVRNMTPAQKIELVVQAVEDPQIAIAARHAMNEQTQRKLQDLRDEKARNMPSLADQKANRAAFDESMEPIEAAMRQHLAPPLGFIEQAAEEVRRFTDKNWEIPEYEECLAAARELNTQLAMYAMLHDLDAASLAEDRKLLGEGS
jgi:hypothetical protein